MNPFGILLGMAIDPASTSSNGTTRAERPASAESSSSDLASGLGFEPMLPTLSLCGGTSAIDTTSNKASTARSSVTKARIERRSSFDRRTQSLITFGLVRGITPSSIRRQSGAAIRDFVSLPLDGGAAASRPKAFSFSNASDDANKPSGTSAIRQRGESE